jgi:hypothetical protein
LRQRELLGAERDLALLAAFFAVVALSDAGRATLPAIRARRQLFGRSVLVLLARAAARRKLFGVVVDNLVAHAQRARSARLETSG